MKPFDLYQHFYKFCEMLENDKLTIEARLDMGKEWLRSLPASMICVPYELSQSIVAKAMAGRLQEEEIKHGRGQGKAAVKEKEHKGEVPRESTEGPVEEPVHSDAGNRGGETSVEDLDGPKVPKAKRQGTRKA